MRRTRRGPRIAKVIADRAKEKKRSVRWEQEDFQESSDGTRSYAARVVLRNPKSGRRMPANVGIVVSEGFVMMWLKT